VKLVGDTEKVVGIALTVILHVAVGDCAWFVSAARYTATVIVPTPVGVTVVPEIVPGPDWME
jgi:hypothetical protein